MRVGEEQRVAHVRCELRNAAGADHAALVALGEDRLNHIIAASDPAGAAKTSLTSNGDGFSTACACAKLLGGTLRLSLATLPSEVVATLVLPLTQTVPPPLVPIAEDVDLAARISALSVAIIDDLGMNRKMLERTVRKASATFSHASVC